MLDNIRFWLEFVLLTPKDELIKIINEDLCIEDHLKVHEVCLIEKPLLIQVKNKLEGTENENLFWEKVLWFISIDSLPDEVVKYLIDNKKALSVLGHLPLKDEFLWKLTDEVEESILTLGKRYYNESQYSPEEFELFLRKFLKKEWLWSSLLSNSLSNKVKRKILVRSLFRFTEFNDLKESIVEDSIEKSLIKTPKIGIIINYYSMGNAKFMRGIAQNPLTPVYILNELINIKNVKYASQIRQLASNNLKKKK